MVNYRFYRVHAGLFCLLKVSADPITGFRNLCGRRNKLSQVQMWTNLKTNQAALSPPISVTRIKAIEVYVIMTNSTNSRNVQIFKKKDSPLKI